MIGVAKILIVGSAPYEISTDVRLITLQRMCCVIVFFNGFRIDFFLLSQQGCNECLIYDNLSTSGSINSSALVKFYSVSLSS